jgi:hypothetical protein
MLMLWATYRDRHERERDDAAALEQLDRSPHLRGIHQRSSGARQRLSAKSRAEVVLSANQHAVDFFNATIERYPNHLGRTVLWVGTSTLYGAREHPKADVGQFASTPGFDSKRTVRAEQRIGPFCGPPHNSPVAIEAAAPGGDVQAAKPSCETPGSPEIRPFGNEPNKGVHDDPAHEHTPTTAGRPPPGIHSHPGGVSAESGPGQPVRPRR